MKEKAKAVIEEMFEIYCVAIEEGDTDLQRKYYDRLMGAIAVYEEIFGGEVYILSDRVEYEEDAV